MYFFLFFIILGVSIASVVSGAEPDASNFVPLVGLPYIQDASPTHFGDYVTALYYAAISIGALLAVIKIIFAGIKYMLTDVVTTKSDAKKDIYGALIGLLIIVSAVLILQTINPRLLEINLFTNAPVLGVDIEPIGIDNPYNINPGDTAFDTDGSINERYWAQSCSNNGGVFKSKASGYGFNIFITYKCFKKETTPDGTPEINEEEIISRLCPENFKCEYKKCEWSLFFNQCGRQCRSAHGYLDDDTLGCVTLQDTVTQEDTVLQCISSGGFIRYTAEECAEKSCTPKGGTVEIGVVLDGKLIHKNTPVCVIRN